ncbi:syncoilin-like isoform X2 [Brachyhypopomus gauderio]|uniref:syncoilin-like isoform X2 n=1 Tax=Brachyhypopomus gauderio TaxID=698409 RepID=UPI004042F6B1
MMSQKGEEQMEMEMDVQGCEDVDSDSRSVGRQRCERSWVEGEESERRCSSGGVVDSDRSLTGEETPCSRDCQTAEPPEQSETPAGRPAWDGPAQHSGALTQWRVDEEAVRSFKACIEETARLQWRREELVRELLVEEEVLARAAAALRTLVVQARTDLARALLRKQRMQEDVARVKKQLFATARECVQSQEELQAEVLEHLQELECMRKEHPRAVAALVERAQGSGRPRAMSDLSHCRWAAADLARHTRTSMTSLDNWYEPRLMALMSKRQAVEVTLQKTREVGQNLKGRLRPLMLETQRLELERARLQRKTGLMDQERRDSLALHRETVSALEDRIRGLKTELQVQISTNQQLAELNDCLTTKTALYRRCLGYTGD